jgi:ABC-2 type transport system permease protein
MLLQYRIAALAGIGTQFFFGLVRVMVFQAFFRSSTVVQPMTLAQTVTYIWLGQALLGILPWNGDAEVQELVRTGNVAYEICRPVDLYGMWFSRCVALRTATTALRAIPVMAMAGLLAPAYRVGLPPSAGAAVAFAVSLAGAVPLSAAITNLYGIVTMWTISGEGISRIIPTLAMLLSGLTIPLAFFPDWLHPIIQALPFAGVMDLPFRFYLGSLPPWQIVPYLAFQLAWTIALAFLGRRLLATGLRRVVVQGG